MLINSPSTDANMPYGLPAGFGQNNGVMIGNTEFRAASAQDLQNALDFVAAKASKPVDELTYTDMLRAFSYKAFTNRLACAADNTSASWIVDLGTAVHGTAQSSSTVSNNFAQQEYFGEVIPMYTQHLASYFSWGGFNPQLSGLSASLQAGAVASVGKALYSDNYGGVTPALDAVDPSTLDPSVTALLGQMFGADTAFNVGHMNALKLLGLLQGNASAGPESWQLSLDGQTVLAGMRGSDTRFVPDMALFNIGSAGTAIMDNASGYFNDSGFAPGFDSGFLESQATTLYQEFAGNDSPEISQLSTSADATALLNDLFKLPQGNTSFSNAQINTAIGLGLLNYDGAHSVSVAKNGNLYLQDLAAQAEAKKQAELKKEAEAKEAQRKQDFNNAIVTLSDPLAIDVMDYLEWKSDPNHADPYNGRYYLAGVCLLSNLNPQDSVWNEVAPRSTIAQRQSMIDAAKVACRPENDADLKGIATDSANGHAAFGRNDFANYLTRNGLTPSSRSSENELTIESEDWHNFTYFGPGS